MDLRLLGPLEVHDDDGLDVAIGAPKVRALLIVLALDAGRTVSVQRLVDAFWEDLVPARAVVSLRSYVSNLRRVLPGTEARPRIVTRGRGYLLDVDAEEVDVGRFEAHVRAGRAELRAGSAEAAVGHLEDALELWRGPALADVELLAFALAPIVRLDELRVAAAEDRLDALLALGRHVEVVAEVEAHVTAHPFRERPRLQLMLALHRSGRTSAALDVQRDLRRLLADELG